MTKCIMILTIRYKDTTKSSLTDLLPTYSFTLRHWEELSSPQTPLLQMSRYLFMYHEVSILEQHHGS